MNALFRELLGTLPPGEIIKVVIGLRWTAVVSESKNGIRCGLATTRSVQRGKGSEPLSLAGELHEQPALDLAGRILKDHHPLMRSVAAATINSLLPLPVQNATSRDAETLLAELGAGKRVAVVGHFPFSQRLKNNVGHLDVLEQNPREGDLPADAAAHILPECDVIAVTAMTLLNDTFEQLQDHFPADASVMMLGPSTPLSPTLFNYDLDYLAGSIVQDIDAVVAGVTQSASFRQLHRLGIRKVIMSSSVDT